jgi:rRNA-processing protein FCF1
MDVARIQSRLVDIDASLPALQRALDRLTADKERVDGQLKAPFAELQSLTARRNAIETDIRLADGFERQLNSASSPRERHLIHEECARAFGGESRPGRILQTRRRDLQSVLRNVEKVESRLDRISSMARRVISSVVLDGNNLCYEDQRFVGLSPVIALAYALADRYEVVVVFDAGIRGLTKMNNQQIAFGFPRNSRVHVVATAQAADETILEAASEAGSYVISNDRFRDFTDKAAVSDQRLLRHEIVAGKLFVHDLQVSISFATDHAANPNPEQ